MTEIDSLFLNHQRPVHHPGIDGHHVFSHKAQEGEQQPSHKEKGDHHRGISGAEAVPEQQFRDQIEKAEEETEECDHKSADGGNPKPVFRVTRKRKHRGIVQREKVVVRLPCAAKRLLIFNLLALRPELRHEAPHERRRLVQAPQYVDEGFVVQAESGELFDDFRIAHLPEHFVVAAPKPVDEGILLAPGLFADDDFIPFFPGGDELRNQFRRILEIGAEGDGTVSGRLQSAIIRRVELPEILQIEDGFDLAVFCADFPNDLPRPVLTLVVDKQNFICVRQVGELLLHRLIDSPDILFFVIAGNHDGDGFHFH